MMDRENCHVLLESLSDYLDGELGNEICSEIEKHLAECENCRIVVDSLRKTIYLYHASAANAEPAEVPEDVRERLFKRLSLEDYQTKEH